MIYVNLVRFIVYNLVLILLSIFNPQNAQSRNKTRSNTDDTQNEVIATVSASDNIEVGQLRHDRTVR